MRLQPNRDYVSNDDIQTPPDLAARIVAHFAPTGSILEPCKGDGNFLRALPPATQWCEIKENRNFFDWLNPIDWIMTNPPWSQIRPFLRHSMTVAENIVFLMTINHLWTKARLRDIRDFGYGIEEIALVDMPVNFPQSGFQLGAIKLARGHQGQIRLSNA